jgi:hypothetical protein
MKTKPKEFPSHLDERKFKRADTVIPGMLIFGNLKVRISVLDLSIAGAKIRTDAPIDAGRRISLAIDGFGSFPAEVVWRREGRIGIRFRDEPSVIAEALPEHIATRVDAVPEDGPAEPKHGVAAPPAD